MTILDIILLLAVLALAAALFVVRMRADRARSAHQTEGARLKAERDRLAAENQLLAPYRPIIDVRVEIDRLRQEAHERISAENRQASEQRLAIERESGALMARAEAAANALTSQAQAEVAKARADANQALREARERAESAMQSANAEAKAVVENATKRAQEIAGSAFEAMQNAEKLERTAKAMKNIIEGYGDRYLIPSQSLLDDLAEEYGFAEAGVELKNARERTRAMVKNGTAATCDYAEANRRETAIRFVADAFNGKVDSILSRVKDDNFGTLAQEIRDAFTLVNHDGAAFRNARVVDTYLEARLTELRWAVTVQELKLRDREEQRRIKEQMREEAKVQREIERALRESAKEEEMLRKAMEKVQDQIAKASEAQRQQYEAKLAEMTDKMRKLEEDRQRTKSMAEQTKTGHVYVISNLGSFGENVYKIGLTRRLEPTDRVRELGDASVPFPFDIHAMINSTDAPALERQLHKVFLTAAVNKENLRKEFFRADLATIRAQVDKLGLPVKWTMTAEAREYRETLALEKSFAENPKAADEWLRLHSDLAEAQFDEAIEDEEAQSA